MDEVALDNYLAGINPGPVEAGRLGADLARFLGVAPGTVVWLSDYNHTKIRYRHPKITYADYLCLPAILASGFVSPGHQDRSLEICLVRGARPMMACIKKTTDGKVYLTTLHAVDRKEARRLYRKAKKHSRLLRGLDAASEKRLLQGGKSA